MKKLFTVLAVCLISAVSLSAQNKTRIGAAHDLDFGGYWSYGQEVANNGALFMDINAATNNMRTRISLGWLERTHFCPEVAADVQYLFGKEKGLFYVYPTAGLYVEQFHKEFNLGAQAGLGFELQFSENFGFFAEGGYQYLFLNNGVGRAKTNVGLKFAF